MDITAVIITHNEADRLPEALASLDGVCDEILVVDSYSTDETLAVARAQGARVVQHVFSDYSAQKNFANSLASCSWILSLDADERLSPLLVKEIRALKSIYELAASGFSFSRKTWYLGRFVTHSGWYPDRKVRLFARNKARWEGQVHERLVLDGPVENLTGDLLHYTYRGIADHVARLNRYSTFLAQTIRTRSRMRLLFKAMVSPFFTFLRHYVLKAGFLDGFAGLVIALISSYGTALKYLKAYELVMGTEQSER
jgi:glycosyltransferase involved in cell wall biosynthesis